jgi:hypothetical protein
MHDTAAPPAVETPSQAEREVHIFLHLATIGRYQEVLDETLAAIKGSGLDRRARSIQIGAVGSGPINLAVLPAATLRRWGDDVSAYEHPTLDAIRLHALGSPDSRYLYLNCLGGRHVGAGWRVRASWRRMLGFLLVQQWRERLVDLDGHDVVGVSWYRRPMPHMTSNNWWARGCHIAALPTVEEFVHKVENVDFSGYASNWADAGAKRRHAGEYWIGSRTGTTHMSCLPLKALGLPVNVFGEIPWWGYDRVDWLYCSERFAKGHFSIGPEVSWQMARASLVLKDWLKRRIAAQAPHSPSA